MPLTIVAFLVVLAVLVLAHELGHFVTAKASGIKVEEFGLGFPPRLLSIKRGDTRYSLNAVPLGGFVKMAGEEDPKVLGSLASKKAGTRLLVLSAGAIMNLLLPLLLFSIAFMVPQQTIVAQMVVEEAVAGSPAARVGISPGDIILSVDGRKVNNLGDVQRDIQLNLGKPITIAVQHDTTVTNVKLVPRWKPPEGEGAIGIVVRTVSPTIVSQSYPFWRAIPLGVRECIDAFVLFKNGIISMIIGAAPATVAGPVGIAQITGEVARAGISPLMEFAAFLSINLGIINILPLPALDGGRIAFVVVEWFRRGERVSPKVEGLIHTIGFFMLMALILAITYQDILRIIRGESLIP